MSLLSLLRRALLLVAALGLLACGDGRDPLVVYSPHGRDLLMLVEREFEARHPGIDVRWLDMGSQEVYDRIRSERANPQASVWYGGPDTILARGAADGLLAPYRPAWADAVPPGSHHPDELYWGVYRTPPLIVYNEDAVAPEEAPRDWDDLLDPRWRDRILLRDPLASGTMRTVFGMIVARSVTETGGPERGFDWLRRLDAQTREYVANPALLHERMIRREGVVTMWEMTDILILRARGAPLGYSLPTSGSPVINDALGLVAGAPNPEAGRAFIDWVGSREGVLLAAEEAFRLPVRTDLPPEELPAWAREVLDELVVADVDWDLIERHGTEWMGVWDRTIRGRGGRR